jgi:hypothetical protein
MTALALIKLALGLGAFLFIVAVGGRNKRIAGVLLTFPIMNGVAMLTSADPFRVADAIALLAVFNTLLFWVATITVQWLPPRPERFPPLVLLVCRVLVWTTAWGVAAYWLTDQRDRFPSPLSLFGFQLVIAIAALLWLWSPKPDVKQNTPSTNTMPDWLSWAIRIALFLAVYAALLYTAQYATDQKWAGMASALPIIGFFGLAALSTENSKAQLQPIRDTVLLGPLLVIPFNWGFAAIVTTTPAGPSGVFHIAELAAAWVVALALVFGLVPILERYLDRRPKLQRSRSRMLT